MVEEGCKPETGEVREGGDPASENHPMGDKDRELQVCGSPLDQR